MDIAVDHVHKLSNLTFISNFIKIIYQKSVVLLFYLDLTEIIMYDIIIMFKLCFPLPIIPYPRIVNLILVLNII